VYDANDSVENLRQRREVATLLRAAGMGAHEANTLAILGGIAATNGQALRQAAQRGGFSFDQLRQLAIGGGGHRIVGSILTVEEAYACLAAMGHDRSRQPVAFHCIEDGCHARAQLMIDQLQQLGVNPQQIRRVWAFSQRAWGRALPRMGATDESGCPLLDYAGRVIEWDYHVAPAVLAEEPSGTTVSSVLDPSLLGNPAGMDLWHQRAGTPLQLALTAQVTELGVAPLHPATGQQLPGSGYRPWADPPNQTPSTDADRLMMEIMLADVNLQRPARPLPPL
jgi:hypothetical protein